MEVWNFSVAQKISFLGVSRPLAQSWREQSDLFDRVEVFAQTSLIHETSRGAEMVSGAALTPGTFDLLGVAPVRGRTFAAYEGRDGAIPTAVVSERFRRAQLGRVEDLTNLSLILSGVTHQVVGVMPASFRFPTGREDVWTAVDLDAPPQGLPVPGSLRPLARLAPGVTFASASLETESRGERLAIAAGRPPGMTARLMVLSAEVDARTSTSLWVMAATVGFLFLIVCANVANLALSRSLVRARDLATCAALGASRGSLLRTAVCEQLMISCCGAAAGFGIATLGLHIAHAVLPASMVEGTLTAITLDLRVVLFMMSAALVTAVICGLPSALLAARTSVTGLLSRDGRTTAGSRAAGRFRGVLVIAEVAVSITLLVGAALMARSFVALSSVGPGYNPEQLLAVRLGLPAVGYQERTRRDQAAVDVAARIAALPGVTGVTVGELPSETSMLMYGEMEFDHLPGERLPATPMPVHEVTPDYFHVLELPMAAGRAFRADDAPGSVVVNQKLAARFFPGGDAVGRRFRIHGKSWQTIVGVAGDTVADREQATQRFEVYCPLGQATDVLLPAGGSVSSIVDFRTVLVRTAEPPSIVRLITQAVHDSDRSIVVWKTSRVEEMHGEALARPRVVFAAMTIFAAVGLVIAMIGLYGVLSYLVTQRRREIGVRIALGAGRAEIHRLVFGRGFVFTAVGIVLGLTASWPLTRLMQSLLIDVGRTDPLAVFGAVVLMAATAFAACWWPARDAGRTDPVALLRD